MWGPQAKQFLQTSLEEDNYMGYCLTEHHQRHAEALAMETFLDQQGVKACASIARPSDTSPSGARGGVVTGLRKFIHSSSFRSLAKKGTVTDATVVTRDDATEGDSGFPFDDWCPVCLHLAGANLVIITVYLDCCIKAAGRNLAKLSWIGAFLATIREPWVLLGDFNMHPNEQQKSGWPARVGGTVWVPADTTYTYSEGQAASLIDFAVISERARDLVINFGPHDGRTSVPWRGHIGLSLQIRATPKAMMTRTISLPRPFAHPELPGKPPDPTSKRSRAKAERQGQRELLYGKWLESGANPQAPSRRLRAKTTPDYDFRGDLALLKASVSALDDPDADEPSEPEEEPGVADPDEPSVDISLQIDTQPDTEPINTAALDGLWILARFGDQQPEAQPPKYITDTVMYQAVDAGGTGEASLRYGNWVQALERFYCMAYRVEPTARAAHTGRAIGREFKLCSVARGSDFPRYVNKNATWWSEVAAHLRPLTLLKQRERGAKQQEHHAKALARMAPELPSQPRSGRSDCNKLGASITKCLTAWPAGRPSTPSAKLEPTRPGSTNLSPTGFRTAP